MGGSPNGRQDDRCVEIPRVAQTMTIGASLQAMGAQGRKTAMGLGWDHIIGVIEEIYEARQSA